MIGMSWPNADMTEMLLNLAHESQIASAGTADHPTLRLGQFINKNTPKIREGPFQRQLQ